MRVPFNAVQTRQLLDAAKAEQARRRDRAWREAQEQGLPEAKTLFLIAQTEAFAELDAVVGHDDCRSLLARAFAVLLCPGPAEECCTNAAALVDEAGYGDYDPLDMLAVLRHPALAELRAALADRDEDDLIRIYNLACDAGDALAEPGDAFPAEPGRFKLKRQERGLGLASW